MNKQLHASLILENARIFTAETDNTFATSLAIRGEQIVAIGTESEIADYTGPNTDRCNLDGRFVMPGFNDAHLHFEGGGRAMTQLNLYGITSLAEVLERVQAAAKNASPGEWIVGRGWNQASWNPPQWPTKTDLDRLNIDHPIYLRRVDGHAIWVNSLALKFAKIDRHTPDPEGGIIMRDAVSREPTGILKETATDLVTPNISAYQSRRYLELAMKEANRFGITSVQEMGAALDVLATLRRENKLTVRIHTWGELEGDFANYDRFRREFPASDPFLTLRTIKGFVDGTLGSSTAAMLRPYADHPQTQGTLIQSEETLFSLVENAAAHGYQVHLHAIGDRGVRVALHAIAHARAKHPSLLRHRIEHAQFVDPDDISLFLSTNSIASIQPCHLVTDQQVVDQRMGKERAKQTGYLWQTLSRRGVPIALGTDWPVEPMDPFRNLYAAVTRKRPDDASDVQGWNIDERLTIAQAIRAYTQGSAYAAHNEDRLGTLTPGKFADLIVLDQNPFEISPEALLKTRVLATIVGGKIVYGELPCTN